MSDTYQPSQKTLQKYADVLVNFALNNGKGIRKGDVVRVVAWESAKPLYLEVQKAILAKGGHLISGYRPDDDRSFNFSKAFFDLADKKQLDFFPENYMSGLVEDVDHNLILLSEADRQALKEVEPWKMLRRSQALKPLSEWFSNKENEGRFSWSLALYGTPAMAQEAGMSLKQYWTQISKACYLDKQDPVAMWKETMKHLERIRAALDRMDIASVHVTGKDVDLRIRIGDQRRWVISRGHNIPSFEVFTSPDWRGTNGWIRFNQPLYYSGNIITGIELRFENGKVVQSNAAKNQALLREMVSTKGADKVGEFSLTDKRHSRITQFMAHTLYDENMGGKFGNTHMALGRSYADTYNGDPAKMTARDWQKLGFNDSSVHTDIISTADRTVTATLKDGTEKVIYENGQFVI